MALCNGQKALVAFMALNVSSRIPVDHASEWWLGRKDSSLQPSDPERCAISPIALPN